jgi:uncharacterized protein YciU (UPF0263 family)
MRKGFALGTALMMVLMAFVVLIPSGVATEDDLYGDPVPIITTNLPYYRPIGYLGDAFTLVFWVVNPLGEDLTAVCTLPPSVSLFRPTVPPEEILTWTVPQGSSEHMFAVFIETVGPEDHWETITIELFDSENNLVAWNEDELMIYAFDGFTKSASLLDGSIELNTELNWLFEIIVANTDMWAHDWSETGMYDIIVTDSFGPLFEIHDSDPLTPEFDPYEMTQGTFEYTTNGDTAITWTVGDLAYLEEARLVLEVSTDGFSAPGRYELNSGAEVTFVRYIPCTTYIQHGALTAEITVNAPGNWNIRTIGFWKHQFNCALGNKKNAYQHVPTEALLAYLAEMVATSTVPKLQETDTLQEAYDILMTKNNADMYDKAVTQLLATWMNYLSGNDMWDSDGDGEADTDILDTILWAEAGLVDLDPDNDEDIKDVLDMLNNSGDE